MVLHPLWAQQSVSYPAEPFVQVSENIPFPRGQRARDPPSTRTSPVTTASSLSVLRHLHPPSPLRGTATRPQTAMPAAALKPGEQTEEPRGTTCTPASEQQLTVSLVESLTRDRTSVPLCACGPRCGSVHTHLPALRDSTRA